MDSIINAGKQFLQDQQESRQGQDNQGQHGFGGGNAAHGGNYPAGGGFSGNDNDEDDFRRAHQAAERHSGNSGNSDMFSNILGAISQKQGHLANEDIDEEDAVRQHRNQYDNDHEADDRGVGTAAAMQALKMFNKGSGGGGQSKGDFMGLAMSEASKLFDAKASQGKVSGGSSKESAIQQAGEVALKMYMKSQGGSSGGLMGLASKFM